MHIAFTGLKSLDCGRRNTRLFGKFSHAKTNSRSGQLYL